MGGGPDCLGEVSGAEVEGAGGVDDEDPAVAGFPDVGVWLGLADADGAEGFVAVFAAGQWLAVVESGLARWPATIRRLVGGGVVEVVAPVEAVGPGEPGGR